MTPFLTGSHAYGTPNDKSDIDLVVYTDIDTFIKLRDNSDIDLDKAEKYGELPPNSVPLRFGKLNLLVCTDPIAYACWLKATNELKELHQPVSRGDAIAHFKRLRKLYNIYAETKGVILTDPERKEIPF